MNEIPTPRIKSGELDSFFEALRVRPPGRGEEPHIWKAPATDSQFAETEALLGRALPVEFKALYSASDGFTLFGEAFTLMPLTGDPEEDEINGIDQWHEEDDEEEPGRIPGELIEFASIDEETMFGLWIPEDRQEAATAHVVQIFERSMFLHEATSLCRFLRTRLTIMLLSMPESGPALDALSVPQELRLPVHRIGAQYEKAEEALRDWIDPEGRALRKPYNKGLFKALRALK